jgi:GMP synthase-like glutamine amidotransferase
MKIGILECGHTMPEVEIKHGGFPAMFQDLLKGQNFSYATYDVENMVFPKDVAECDGWLLTGSKHGAYEAHDFIPPLEEFIRTAYSAKVPMVGICFGHQIIAQALGGKVEKFKDGWALGLNEYAFEGHGSVKLNAWHQDQVIERPKGAKPIASNAFCENAALLYDGPALTIQAHPEFKGPLIEDYVALRRGTADYPDDLMDKAAQNADASDSNALMAAQISQFFLQAHEASRA